MRAFLTIWLGQLASIVGTRMTAFAMAIWAWEETGQATALALVMFFSFLPTVFLSPLAGVIIDHWNRRTVLVLADIASGLATVAILGLFLSGQLEIWHLYVLGAWSGAFDALQTPAFSAATATLVPKEHYARANALRSLATSLSAVAAPVLAGILLLFSGVAIILILDICTFVLAVISLGLVTIPHPSQETSSDVQGLWHQMLFGFQFLFQRKGLLWLLLIFSGFNFLIGLGVTTLSPMILAKTGNNEIILGSVQSALGMGGILGGVFVSIWGGPKRRIIGIAVGLTGGALSVTGFGLGDGIVIWMLAAFFTMFFLPMVDAFFGAIYQSEVPPDVQGRVFASSRMFAHLATPLAMGLAGPLADFIFEPLFSQGGMPDWITRWTGVGPGAGMAFMLVLTGTFGVLISFSVYILKPVWEIEGHPSKAYAELDTSVDKSVFGD